MNSDKLHGNALTDFIQVFTGNATFDAARFMTMNYGQTAALVSYPHQKKPLSSGSPLLFTGG